MVPSVLKKVPGLWLNRAGRAAAIPAQRVTDGGGLLLGLSDGSLPSIPSAPIVC
jgi:hypothetical protein